MLTPTSRLAVSISMMLGPTFGAEAIACEFSDPHELHGVVKSIEKMSDSNVPYLQVTLSPDTPACERRYSYGHVTGTYSSREVLLIGRSPKQLSDLRVGDRMQVAGVFQMTPSHGFGFETWYYDKFVVSKVAQKQR